MTPRPCPAPGLRLRLIRDLVNATGEAYAKWPGKPPTWLNEMCSAVEARLERAERRQELPKGRRAPA